MQNLWSDKLNTIIHIWWSAFVWTEAVDLALAGMPLAHWGDTIHQWRGNWTGVGGTRWDKYLHINCNKMQELFNSRDIW